VQFVNNEPEQIEIRKSQNTLIVVGSGIVLFSIWTVVKTMGTLFLLRKETVEGIRNMMEPVEGITDDAVFLLLIVMFVVFSAVLMGIRMYVGMSAIAEGRGKRRSRLYIFIAIVMIIGNILYFFTGFFSTGAPEQLGALSRDQSISTLIIDATSVIMLTQMVISALKIRKFRKAAGKERTAKG
jgi:hypothetical protein